MFIWEKNNDNYRADEFYYKESQEFIPTIALLPGTVPEALRVDPALHLDDSLDYMTPAKAHEKSRPIPKKWKTYKKPEKQKEVTMAETQ
jgi:hypothetical protein